MKAQLTKAATIAAAIFTAMYLTVVVIIFLIH